MIDYLTKRVLLNIPEDDPEKALSVKIFNYVCLSVIAFLVVCGAAAVFVFVGTTIACISTLALLLVLTISVSFAHRGRLRFGSAFLVIGLWIVFTVQVGLTGGIDTIFAALSFSFAGASLALVPAR